MKDRILDRLRGTAPAADVAAAALVAAPAGAAGLFKRALTPAAVLVPIIERSAGMTVLLTRRTDHLRDHAGQISFPGGRIAGDEGPLAAALRETQEELGIPPESVEVAGYLPAQAVVTGFAVTPVVGFLPAAIVWSAHAGEVAEVFEVPLAFILDEGNLRAGVRSVGGIEWPLWEYQYGVYRIWGATAGILNSLRLIIESK